MDLSHEHRELLAFIFTPLIVAYNVIMSVLGLATSPISFTQARGSGEPPSVEMAPIRGRSRSQTPGQVTVAGDRYPGMVNLSGTLCYMNSVLQAFASLPAIVHHLEHIIHLAENADIVTPVTDALFDTLHKLNTGAATQPAAIRPIELLQALAPLPPIRRLLATREQQDAHELFVVLSEAVSDEANKVADGVGLMGRGFGQAAKFILSDNVSESQSSVSRGGSPGPLPPTRRAPIEVPKRLPSPLDGLLSRQRQCRVCSYLDPVRLDNLGGMELGIPQMGDTTLDQCIAEALADEPLDGVTCDRCTAEATLARYAALEKAIQTNGVKLTPVLKKQKTQAAEVTSKLRRMLEIPNNSIDLESLRVKVEPVRTSSVRHTSVARAPAALRFHFIRNGYTNDGRMFKKMGRVSFPLMFDLGPHMARGVVDERSTGSQSIAAMLASGAAKPGGSAAGPPPRALYRLESAILHHGAHTSSGHYVTIRRKPNAPMGIPGKGWLHISDANVEEVGSEIFAASRPYVFMLFYEKVDLPARAYVAPQESSEARAVENDVGQNEIEPESIPYPPHGLSSLGLPTLPFQTLGTTSMDSTD